MFSHPGYITLSPNNNIQINVILHAKDAFSESVLQAVL